MQNEHLYDEKLFDDDSGRQFQGHVRKLFMKPLRCGFHISFSAAQKVLDFRIGNVKQRDIWAPRIRCVNSASVAL